MVALHLDNNTAKASLHNQGGTIPLFLSRLACHILNMADMHGITLIPAYISAHLNVETDYLSQRRLVPDCKSGVHSINWSWSIAQTADTYKLHP